MRARLPVLASLLAVLSCGVPRARAACEADYVVTPVYFVPRGSAVDPQWQAKLQTLFVMYQDFYAAEMARHGFGERRFNMTMGPDGRPVVVIWHGAHDAAWYGTPGSGTVHANIQAELETRYDRDHHLIAYVAEEIGAYLGGRQGGTLHGGFAGSRNVLASTGATRTEQIAIFCDRGPDPLDPTVERGQGASIRLGGLAHEIGHALGSQHAASFDDVMGLGTHHFAANFTTCQEYGPATWERPLMLDNSPMFRAERFYADRTIPTVSLGIPTVVQGGPLVFDVTATDAGSRPAVLHLLFRDLAVAEVDLRGQGTTVHKTVSVASPQPLAVGAYPAGAWVLDGHANRGESGAPLRVVSGDLEFHSVAPCRLVDTRLPEGPLGGPHLGPGASRTFRATDTCAVPASAVGLAVNLAVHSTPSAGQLFAFAEGTSQPASAVLEFAAGEARANNAVAPLSGDGSFVLASTAGAAVPALVDVDGYFAPAGEPGGLAFHPTAPCRQVDTRGPNPPALAGGVPRDFQLRGGPCGVPSSAAAVAANVTAVEPPVFGHLTVFPAGLPLPGVSLLNLRPPSRSIANGALRSLRAGSGPDVTARLGAVGTAHALVDLTGWFGPSGGGGRTFRMVPPCRVVDTREPSLQGGSALVGSVERNFQLRNRCEVPAGAQAVALNAVIRDPTGNGFLSLRSPATPVATSILNFVGGEPPVMNGAVVPLGPGPSADVVALLGAPSTTTAQLVIDVVGYY